DEGRRRRKPRGGDRGGASDRRRSRHRLEASRRLLLQPDDRHVGSADRRLGARRHAGDDRRDRRTHRRPDNGRKARMSPVLRSWQGSLALLLCLSALAGLPLLNTDAPLPFGTGTTAIILLLVAAGADASFARMPEAALAAILFVTAHLTAWLLLAGIAGNEGHANLSYFLLIAASW